MVGNRLTHDVTKRAVGMSGVLLHPARSAATRSVLVIGDFAGFPPLLLTCESLKLLREPNVK
jgi:hypothetical protein